MIEEIIKEVTISFDVFEASGEQPSAHELINSSYVRGPPALEEKYVKNVSFMLAVLTTNFKTAVLFHVVLYWRVLIFWARKLIPQTNP